MGEPFTVRDGKLYAGVTQVGTIIGLHVADRGVIAQVRVEDERYRETLAAIDDLPVNVYMGAVV